MAESVQTPLPRRVPAASAPARAPWRHAPRIQGVDARPPSRSYTQSHPRAAQRRAPGFLWAALLTAVVSATAVVAVPPVFVSSGAAISAALGHPAAYVAAAPLSTVLDALSLLSLRQHLALLATVLLAYVIWRIRRTRATPSRAEAVHSNLRSAAGLLGTVVVVYAVGLLIRRPMAALALRDPDQLTVDFHSHTDASHDGRPGFSAEANREWHRAAGFDVGYVSDHRSLAGALEARANNPAVAGSGTVLLPAIESVCRGQHVLLLGIQLTDSQNARRGCGVRRPTGHADDSAAAPLVIFALPGDPASLASLPNLVGAELVDGAPRALDQTVRFESRLRRAAGEKGLALLANSNNHGWGRTAVGWNVMTVPGWRGMTPDALDAAIVRQLRANASHAVVLVERRRIARHDRSLVGLALTVPSLAWLIVTTLSWPERLAWISWIWIGWGMALAFARLTSAAPAVRVKVLSLK